MAKVIDEKILKGTSWNGYKGSRVQEYIEEQVGSKIGAIYKEPGGTMVYCFSTEEDKNLYLSTSGASGTVLTTFETISKYSVKINTEGLRRSYSVINGTTGNTVAFEFKIIDDNDMTPDSRASINYSFLANGTSNEYTVETQVNSDGWTAVESEIIDDYLKNGENTITVTITGLSSKASTSFIITYNIFDLDFIPSFDYYKVQDGNTVEVSYSIKCSETKYLEFYLDGKSVESNESMVIQDISKSSTANIDISSLSAGTHTLQVRAYVKAKDGTNFYTPSYFYTFAKIGSSSPSFLMSMQLDNTQEIALNGENLAINVDQFTQITFDWAMYDNLSRKLIVIFEYEDSVLAKTVSDRNEETHTYTFRPMNDGEGKQLKIYAYGENNEKLFEQVVDFTITETSSGIKEATDGLLLKLQATGRRNEDDDKDVWSCVGTNGATYSAEFSGFTWNSQQGWDEDTESLVISNGATVSFNIQPMVNDWSKYGGTLEIDLETFDIDDDDAVICECKDNIEGRSSAFFRITATKAEFSTANGKKISTRYKDNERLKIAFIGNKIGSLEDDNMIYIVVNGVLERAALYTDTDKIQSDAYLTIGNPEGKCKVRLRSIRAYKKAISVDDAFNNFVVDSDDVQAVYERNNVLKAGTTEIGFDEVANKLPVMIFTGDMNKLCTEGQANKDWYPFDVEYINRREPERNFVSFNCQMKLQGTSSLGYPRKNFKLKTKDKTFTKESYAASRYVLDETSQVGNRVLKNKTTGAVLDFGGQTSMCITLDYKGEALKKGKYRFRADSHKADRWTLKADFMESSCSHNVGAGRSWNDIFRNTVLTIDTNAGYSNNTYKNEARQNKALYKEYTKDGVTYKIPSTTDNYKAQKDYVCRTEAQKICEAEQQDDVRTAVDGFPMVCFYRTSHVENDLVFMGQYNFINDKSSYEVFGFEDIEDPADDSVMIYDGSEVECWEGLKNANPISLFQTTDNWSDPNSGWASTFESRYPDPDDINDPDKRHYDASSASPLYELCKWLVSTRHVGYDVPTGNTLDVNSEFAEHINGWQYGYSETTKDRYEYFSGTSIEDNAENRQKKFETEKWEHFDVWKLAGYYIFLMRYGAVDQFVKNTMLFTEGNGNYDWRTDKKYRKWYYINYDNDCLFGLRNNGELAFGWDLDRQTLDGAADIIKDDQADDEGNVNTYAMMGHDSTLWNNLEADDEFMRMVRDLDNSMSQAGLNYDNMVEEFDTKQTEQWCERIYNANERYKYINAAKGLGDMADREKVDNLWMLQGTRRSHRHWWIANHFDLLDAKWLSGNYKNTYMELKMTTPSGGTPFTAIAGENYYFAWGQQKRIYESNIEKKSGETITFVSANDVQGDPVYVYAINKMSELDCSNLAPYIFAGSFEFHVANSEVSNTLKKLIIGNNKVTNNSEGIVTSSWEALSNLEYLDITNFAGIKSIPLSTFRNLRTLKAKGTSLTSFAPAEGSIYTLVELPNTIASLQLKDIKINEFSKNFVYTPNTNLGELILSNNDGITNIYYNKIIAPWIEAIEASTQNVSLYSKCSLNIADINWSFSSLDNIRIFKNFKKYVKEAEDFSLTGVIDLTSCGNLSRENINEIKEIFGENCFNEKMSSIYVKTPDSIFILSDSSEMVAGQSMTFGREIYPDERAVMDKTPYIEYMLVEETKEKKEDNENVLEDAVTGKRFLPISANTARIGLSIKNTTDDNGQQVGILSSKENVLYQDTKVTVLVKMKVLGDVRDKISFMEFTILDPTYASKASIDGVSSLYKDTSYTYSVSAMTSDGKKPIGTSTTEWIISGDGANYINSSAVTDEGNLVIVTKNEQPEISSPISISIKRKNRDGSVVRASKKVLMLNETVIMTSESNPVAMSICYNAFGLTDSDAMRKSDAEAITSLGTAFQGIESSFTFNELKYFTGLTSIEASAFSNSNITEITLPSTITEIGGYCFDGCKKLSKAGIEAEQNFVATLPNVSTISEGCFRGCESLNSLTLPESVLSIENYAFGNTGFKHMLLNSEEGGDGRLIVDNALQSIEPNAFESERWTSATTVNKLETISIPLNLAFSQYQLFYCKNLKTIIVDEENAQYTVEDGVLYSKNKEAILRYPPMKDYLDTYNVVNGVRTVESYAFFYVQNLDSVILPNSLDPFGLGDCVFLMSNIKNISFEESIKLQVIPQRTFEKCTKLLSVTFPEDGQITTIGNFAFEQCESLEELNLPNSVSAIGKNAIEYCAVKNLVLPDSVTHIEQYGVMHCHSLETVKLPAKLPTSGAQIVVQCSGLTNATLPLFSYTDEDGNNVIVNDVYNVRFIEGCGSLRNYVLNENDNEKIMTIVDGALYSTDKKTLVAAPASITEFQILDGTEKIGGDLAKNSPFYNSSQLKSLIIPDSVISLCDEFIQEKKYITEITIPSGVTEIPSHSFQSCIGLENLKIKGEIEKIGTFAFCGAQKLHTITLLATTAPSIVIYEYDINGEEGGVHRYHPFGYSFNESDSFYTGIDGDKENNVIYVPYGNNGYDAEIWLHPVQDAKWCNYKLKPLPLNSNIEVVIYKNNTLLESGAVYAKSESGDFVYSDGIAKSVCSNGKFTFILSNNAYDNEKITIYSDANCEEELGVITLDYNITSYQIGSPEILSMAKKLFATDYFKASENTVTEAEKEEVEMAQITKQEYDVMNAKISQLTEIVNKLLK